MREMFLTIEGIDGCGKSTQAQKLMQKLLKEGKSVVLTKEPGGTALGAYIRNLLLNKDMEPVTEFLLFAADRKEHIEKIIKPYLWQGIIVISDRFLDSSVAYQGYGRGVKNDFITCVHNFITEGLKPDITFIIDIAPEVGLKRLKRFDRIENGGIALLAKVREGYLEIAREEKRFVVIKGEGNEEEIFFNIWDEFLKRRKLWEREQRAL